MLAFQQRTFPKMLEPRRSLCKRRSKNESSAVAISTIRAVIGDVKYQYLSGPITGGPLFLDWHCTTGRDISAEDYKTARQSTVIRPNISAIQAAAKAERIDGRNTIEPGSFEAEFEQWGQQEFLNFWENVIEQHAACVRFMDGWAYSSGCAFEYVCAMRCGLETCDMQGQALGPGKALNMIDVALADICARRDASDPRDAPLINLHGAIQGYRDEIGTLAR